MSVEEPAGGTNTPEAGTALAFEEDDIVARLVGDPARIPDVKLFAGWVGHSPGEGRVRLYLSPVLDRYLDLDAKDIVDRRTVERTQSAAGGSLVWAHGSAEITYTRTRPAEAQAAFLRGRVAGGMFDRNRGIGLTMPGGDPVAFHTAWFFVTLLVLAIGATVSHAACPDPDASRGLCPTDRSHCC